VLSNIYINQFISVLSNITYNDTITLHSKYSDVLPNDYLSSPNKSTTSVDFIMVVNYYTLKINDLTNSVIDNICIQFRDVCGSLILIRSSYSSGDATVSDEIQQVTFKIEIELTILE
jgi:hypothetical protein